MRKQVLYNLKKNAFCAFQSAIEIHNKPNFNYRYEIVTILLINAWELILKAYIRKYTKKKLFLSDGYSISLDTVLKYVSDDLTDKGLINEYLSVLSNITILKNYRNSFMHFYDEEGFDGILFSLISKNVLDFNNFCNDFFNEDPLGKSNLTILPIGFKLPFDPVDYLSKKNPCYSSNIEIKRFLDDIIYNIKQLNDLGIEDSLVLGFNVYLSDIKKISNSDLICAIDNTNKSIDLNFNKKVKYTNVDGASPVKLSDEDYKNQYPLSYEQVWRTCKYSICNFKKNSQFDSFLRDIQDDPSYCYKRLHNPNSSKSQCTKMYSNLVLEYLKDKYNNIS